MSERASSGLPRICSGLMNSGVPRMMPVAVSFRDGRIGAALLGEAEVHDHGPLNGRYPRAPA